MGATLSGSQGLPSPQANGYVSVAGSRFPEGSSMLLTFDVQFLEGVLMKNKDAASSRDIQLICAEFSSIQVKTQADWMLLQSSYFNPQVPTGRVVVPTGRYVVPAGKVIIIVSPGRLSLVPTGRVLSPGSDNESDDASVHSEATIAQQQQNIQPQIITTVSNNNAKFPYLKKDEYEVWAMKMEYWITNNDMNIWKVIQNGNSLKRTGRDRDGRVIILPPTTADEHIAVQRESKARTTLLQSIPDDHVADFHYMDDARDIWNAVKARFGGNAESKKMRKSMLKQEFSEFRISEAEGLHKGYDRMQKILSQLNQLKAKPEDEDINLKFLRALPSSWSQVALTLKTKGGLELLSFDDLYYKLKTLEVDIKGYSTFSSSQSAGPSHFAFISTTSASKKISYADSPSYSSSTYTALSNSKTGSHRSGNVIEDVLQSFVADTEPEQQLAYEDFEQIEKLGTGGDVLEMAKWHASGSTKRRSDEISGERSGEEGPQSARESAVVVRREWVGRCRREDQCEGDMLFLEGCARGGTVRREGRGDGGGGRVRRGRAQGGRGLSDHGVEAEGRCVDRSGGCESGWGGTLEVGFERLYTMTVRRQVCSVLVTREEDGIRQSGIHNKELDSRGEGVKRLLDDLYRKVGGSMELSESTQGLSAPNRAGYS
ncbi:hypothetical protein Tco_0319309 [Tanacetum coccineum]